MTRQHVRNWPALFLATWLACPPLVFSAAPPARRAQAKAAYERAVELQTKLESQPESSRRKEDYENVRRAFYAVYRADPAYSKASIALATAAELYDEMGRVLSDDRYYRAAIEAYQFLVAQYPRNRTAREAWFRIGEIYRTGLENTEEARNAFQKFLEEFPKSEKAAEAREKLNQLDQKAAEHAPAPAVTPRPAREEGGRAKQTAELTTVRHWVGPNYSRIVIGVDDEVKFDTSRLSNPDRIVLDLEDTRLSRDLMGKTFPVEDGFLRKIRVAQFKRAVTRVVLDVEKIEDYSIFSLPNPFRLVIDIHGTPGAGVTTATKENPTTNADVRSLPSSSSKAREPERVAKERATKPSSSSSRSSKTHPPEQPASTSCGPEVAIKPAAPTESGSRTLTRALGLKVAKIVIDPGHGGHDTGTIGPGGLREKDLVLDVALKLKRLIERDLGSTVIMTRSDDTFVPLEERTAIANQRAADLFISIHANASRDRSARGIETYYLNFTSNPEALEVAARENATSQESVHQLQDLVKKIALTEKIEESHEFAKQVQREVHGRLAKGGDKQRDRGVKKAPFVVLIGANMPSILTEISFLTNPRDERLLKRQEHRQKIAAALYRGLVRYTNNLGGVRVAQKARLNEPPAELDAAPSPAGRPNF